METDFERHRQTMGALHLGLGAANLIACFIVWGVLAGIIGLANEPLVSELLASVGGVVGIILLLAAGPCIAAGHGILRERPWGRSAEPSRYRRAERARLASLSL